MATQAAPIASLTQPDYRERWKSVNLHIKRRDDEFDSIAPMLPGDWLARKYRYADGRVHRDTVFTIFHADRTTGEVAVVGGAVQMQVGECLAYIGDTNPAERVREIIQTSHVRVYGNTIHEVLGMLKKACPTPEKIEVIRSLGEL